MRAVVGEAVGGNAGNSANVRCLPIVKPKKIDNIPALVRKIISENEPLSKKIEIENQIMMKSFGYTSFPMMESSI